MNFGDVHQYYFMQRNISLPLCPICLKLYGSVDCKISASSSKIGGLNPIGQWVSQFHVCLSWIWRYAPVLLHVVPYLFAIESDSPQTLRSCWLLLIRKFTKVW